MGRVVHRVVGWVERRETQQNGRRRSRLKAKGEDGKDGRCEAEDSPSVGQSFSRTVGKTKGEEAKRENGEVGKGNLSFFDQLDDPFTKANGESEVAKKVES